MKLIHKFKSLNFDKRDNKKISYIILHYTALPSIDESINFLCKAENKVSCHYIISQNGKIYNLVDEKNRAWHAGQSKWLTERDLNSTSIGIELDFSPNHNNNKFSKLLISALIVLTQYLKKKYNVDKKNILGHSDIAPLRKIDPGEKFPWRILGRKNLVILPGIISVLFDLRLNPVGIGGVIPCHFRPWCKTSRRYARSSYALLCVGRVQVDG